MIRLLFWLICGPALLLVTAVIRVIEFWSLGTA
jgi:hypothetical protein